MRASILAAALFVWLCWSGAALFLAASQEGATRTVVCSVVDTDLKCTRRSSVAESTVSGPISSLHYQQDGGRNRPALVLLGSDVVASGSSAGAVFERLRQLRPGEQASFELLRLSSGAAWACAALAILAFTVATARWLAWVRRSGRLPAER